MEFKKIRIADLIPASYNPRKKLKKGDREYELSLIHISDPTRRSV